MNVTRRQVSLRFAKLVFVALNRLEWFKPVNFYRDGQSTAEFEFRLISHLLSAIFGKDGPLADSLP